MAKKAKEAKSIERDDNLITRCTTVMESEKVQQNMAALQDDITALQTAISNYQTGHTNFNAGVPTLNGLVKPVNDSYQSIKDSLKALKDSIKALRLAGTITAQDAIDMGYLRIGGALHDLL